MFLERLKVLHFRNLKEQDLSFNTQTVVLVGANGQGKTNLLEAIHLLAQAKSFRGAEPSELVSWARTVEREEPSCEVSAVLNGADGKRELSYHVVNGRRRVLINNKKISHAVDFFGQLQTVEFIPEDLALIRGEPARRRHFIDRVLAMTKRSFLDQLLYYERALKNRNQLLRANRTSPQLSLKELRQQLSVWDEQLISSGRLVAQERAAFVGNFCSPFKHYQQALTQSAPGGGLSLEEATLLYQSDYVSANSLLTVQDLHRQSQESLALDLKLGRTSKGVHRDELHIMLDSGEGIKAARRFASQGQAKTLALALRLASVDYLRRFTGNHPVLLLDDISSELDEGRRRVLFELISKLGCQVFITLTEMPGAQIAQFSERSVFFVRQGSFFST